MFLEIKILKNICGYGDGKYYFKIIYNKLNVILIIFGY
jgi:hypothetical protein